MIGAIFQLINQIIEVRVDGFNCTFRTGEYGGMFVPIDAIRIDKNGAIKEHPDLKDREDWKEETIKRYKEHIKKMNTEMERINYIISELSKIGYKPLYIQRAGHRPQKIK